MCRGCKKGGVEPHLGFHVVGDVVHGASERDLTDRPGGVVREVGGQDADPQLPLVDTWRRHSHGLPDSNGGQNHINYLKNRQRMKDFELSHY